MSLEGLLYLKISRNEEPTPALFKKFQPLSSSVLVQSAPRVPQYIQSPDTHIQPS
jgi:hypothetical protein